MIAIPREEYQAVRVADLRRIRDRMSAAPRESVGWLSAAWALVGLAASAALTAVALDQHSAVPASALWVLAGILMAAACFCGVAHSAVNEERRRFQADLLADMDETVSHLEAIEEPRPASRNGRRG
jgi:fatty acid desaturase